MASGNLSSLRSLHAGSPSESSDIQQQRGGLWESLKFETNDAGAALYLTTPSSRITPTYAALIRGMSASARVTSHESPIRLTHTAVVVIMIVDSCSSAVNLNYNPVSQMKKASVLPLLLLSPLPPPPKIVKREADDASCSQGNARAGGRFESAQASATACAR